MTVDCAAVDFDLSADQLARRDAAAALLDRFAGHDALRARVGGEAIQKCGCGVAQGELIRRQIEVHGGAVYGQA